MKERVMPENENAFDFNFWPSFADLMLAFVLTLLIILFIVAQVLAVGNAIPEAVEKSQEGTIDLIREIPGASLFEITEGLSKNDTGKRIYEIRLSDALEPDVVIERRKTAMRFSFSSNMLFEPDSVELNQRGQFVLQEVGNALKTQKEQIREIQIQGHADPDPSRRGITNLELAALRSINVFLFLQDSVGFDPTEQLMSATSFGEYKPVQRNESNELHYSNEYLREHNRSAELKRKNRRIELFVIYYI